MGKWKVAIADYISHHFKNSTNQASESSIHSTHKTLTKHHPKWPFRRWLSRRQTSKRIDNNDDVGLDQVETKECVCSSTAFMGKKHAEEKSCHWLDTAMRLVGLGMAFGVLYSITKDKQEVEKVKLLLKKKEDLVQDLEEEIEMKGSIIMRELTLDDHDSQTTDAAVVIMAEKENSFSKIEAELEAELEILELSMASSKLERKTSNLVEVDPEFEPGAAGSELRDERLDREANESGTYCANHAVCPTELRLRLHEVLQSQLEERIRELEAQIEVEKFSSSNAGDKNHVDNVDEPVVLNLSGEGLEAYIEAYDSEFAKLDESDDFSDDGDYRTPGDGDGMGGDEMDFEDDEMNKLLIKHIVEKARQESSAVLNMQRALLVC